MIIQFGKSQNIVHKSQLNKCGRIPNFVSYCYKGMCNSYHADLWLYAFKMYVGYLTLKKKVYIFYPMNWKFYFTVSWPQEGGHRTGNHVPLNHESNIFTHHFSRSMCVFMWFFSSPHFFFFTWLIEFCRKMLLDIFAAVIIWREYLLFHLLCYLRMVKSFSV